MTNDLSKGGLAHPSRRVFLAGAASLVAWSQMPRYAFAGQSRDPRLVVVILRGALDGLAVVPPIGDPAYASLRGDLAVGAPKIGGASQLDGIFALNDAMPNFRRRFASGEATVVHAVATPYRDRSHFDGQDVLENGTENPRFSDSGWLNRAVAALPKGDAVRPVAGLAVSPVVPLVLRGDAPVFTWMPTNLQASGPDTADRLLSLYTHSDQELARIFAAGRKIDMLAGTGGAPGRDMAGQFRSVAAGTGKLLAREDGPRVAAISYDGWDTHAQEGPEDGRLDKLLQALDGAFDALALQLGPAWKDTVVVAVTEFGRTAQMNGTDGTDHGTGTVALLVGGAVRGGRIVADWPGLGPTQLYQGRDLKPTTDLRAVLKGVLRDHLGISERVLANDVFPGSLMAKPLDNLIA
ncbi:MAG: DUF1501 domain-containing protein [Rhizobiales bacterium]|nr:DUF1501 domain-containing protein [Hyphomicrobiales bacterium]